MWFTFQKIHHLNVLGAYKITKGHWQGCVTITGLIPEHFNSQGETLCPAAAVTLRSPMSIVPGNHSSTFFLCEFNLLWTFHVNGTWHLRLSIVLSRFMHVVVCVSTSFFPLAFLFNKIPNSCVRIAELLQQSKNPSTNQIMPSSEEIKEGLKRQQEKNADALR